MSFDLAAWHGETALSVKDAADLYLKLCKQEWTPTEWHASVEAFYVELCSRYPEIDTLSDDERALTTGRDTTSSCVSTTAISWRKLLCSSPGYRRATI